MKNWSEEELLNYLMTSDFDDDLSPEDFKSLLIRFRHFYRIVASRSNSTQMEKKRFDFEIEQLKINHSSELNITNNEKEKVIEAYQSITKRRLTFWERLVGKIKPKHKEII
jgi:hypothetical protein